MSCRYAVRTDSDVFITPRLFDWRIPTEAQIIFGRGVYSTTFNKEQLGRIAEELKWKRQGMENVGSTWMVKPSNFVRLSAKARVSHLAIQRFLQVFSSPPKSFRKVSNNIRTKSLEIQF